MRLNDLIKNIPHTGSSDAEVKRIEYNSKRAGERVLFVCLRGAKTDGHNYIHHAYENGCRLFLCEREQKLPPDACQIITPDTRAALAVVSAEFYGHPADELTVIGVTGTKGKTTTALLISAVLNAAGKSCAYVGSNGVIINNTVTETANTTPESHELQHYFRLMVNAGVKYAVIEVSSQALAHNRVDGIRFDTAVFTNLSEDHIGPDEHPDFEHYKNSKARLFSDFGVKNAVYNADDSYAGEILRGFENNRLSYGMNASSDFKGENRRIYRTDTALGVEFDCITAAGADTVRLMMPGTFSIYNGLAVLAVCSLYGVDVTDAARALASTPVRGRCEIVEAYPGRTFIIDYSHNGLSLTNVLKTLREYNPSRLICVFGSVGGRTKGRRKELAAAASEYADYSIITSDNPDFEDPEAIIAEIASYMKSGSAYECVTKRSEAIFAAVRMAREGDIVLFAGKGHETYQLVCGQKQPFSERKLIMQACRMPETV